MNQEAYFKLHQRICDEARELSKLKNNDYASPDNRQDDPFAIWANFMQCEHLNVCSVEQGFCVRLSDKFSRLCNLLRPGHESGVLDEKLDDTVKDIINYTILLLGYLETKRRCATQDAAQELPSPHEAWLREAHRYRLDEPPVETDEEKKAEAKRRAMQNLARTLAKALYPDGDRHVWFTKIWERREPRMNPVDICWLYTEWAKLRAERDGFVCPICDSTYWGTSGMKKYGTKGTGHCHGEQDGSGPCGFTWDRDTEDKFVGVGEKP